MNNLEATFRIVTPVFMGGANQQKAEIRAPSIKGVLRFWWRALNWTQSYEKVGFKKEKQTEALSNLHKEEGELFGTAGTNGKGSQSLFHLHTITKAKAYKPDISGQGSQYLLGQGLYRPKQGCQREALEPNTLSVKCIFHRTATKRQISQIADALTALGMFGGLGSRSRRGWGSLAIQTIKCEGINLKTTVPTNICEFSKASKNIAGIIQQNSNLPPFSAFSANTRCDIISQETSYPMDALNWIGKIFQEYRSWENYKTSGKPSNHPFFPGDHDGPLQAVNGNCPEKLPKRVIFGLPHNYFFKSVFSRSKSAKLSKADISSQTVGQTRRASPLFIHIHLFPDDSVAVVQTLMKSEFIPENANVSIRAEKLRRPCTPKLIIEWEVITDYMDSFSRKTGILP